jgi:hypothetical protein
MKALRQIRQHLKLRFPSHPVKLRLRYDANWADSGMSALELSNGILGMEEIAFEDGFEW